MEAISLNEMKAPKLMRKRFGQHCLRHCMVLLAYDGNVEVAALENRVRKTDWHLKELIEKYGGRFHLFSKNWRDQIRAKAEMDNGWLRTSLARGLGTGLVAGAIVGALIGSIEGPGGMVLYGIIGGAVGGSAGGTAQNSYLKEVRESQKVFSALVNAMEKSHKAVVSAIEKRQKEEETRMKTLLEELKDEVQELRKVAAEPGSAVLVPIDQSEDTEEVVENTAPTLCISEMKDWSKVALETDPCVGVTRRALSDIWEKIKVEVNRLTKSELKRLEKYTDDQKQVRHTDKLREVPDNPKRFDRVANVLAKESFSCGRCYWEVEVEEKVEWNLGVVRQSINRKGKFTVCPANGYWTLGLKTGGQYIANTSPATPLALEPRPKKVAIFLDYTEGRVSFYSAESGVHIYTFTDTFTDRLVPFFSPGRLHAGKNAAPLVISSSFCSI
ncbi:unnamed protein product [Tetraodon nigroviridis]|uniref:(spotted green pufferfish) hypothetical protein n=1 Tax=Tetraodon nigroviridis TaxID=99883 RepID=Q4SE25_TETNG|nr:unnamed protein product [Tetraodon nigroviridis]